MIASEFAKIKQQIIHRELNTEGITVTWRYYLQVLKHFMPEFAEFVLSTDSKVVCSCTTKHQNTLLSYCGSFWLLNAPSCSNILLTPQVYPLWLFPISQVEIEPKGNNHYRHSGDSSGCGLLFDAHWKGGFRQVF